MSSTSLLLVPLPMSIASPQNDQSLAALFQGQSQGQEQLKLSAATKNPNLADEDSYFRYLVVLKALGNAPMNTDWSNPFKSKESIKCQNVYAEALNTIWNFIVFLQNRIINYDASSQEDGKKIKCCIADIHALNEDLQFILQNYQHKVYTADLIQTLKSYTKYMDALLLLQAAFNANPKNSITTVKASQACFNALNEVDSSLTRLDTIPRSFFSQFIPLMKKYYIGLSYFEAGNDQAAKREYGKAIALYRAGMNLMSGYEKMQCPYAQVSSVAKMIYNALKVQESRTTYDNQHIYSKYVPEDAPELPAAFPIKPDMIPPTPGLLLFTNTENDGDFSFGPTPGDYPSVPTSQPTATTSFNIPTGFQGSNSGQPTQTGGFSGYNTQNNPPVFTPQNGTQNQVPIFTPPGSNSQFSPQPMMQQTQSFGAQQYGAQQGSRGSGQADQVFPTWKMLNDLKAKTIQRMQSMRGRLPSAAQIIDQYMQQTQIASQSDSTIDSTIQRFLQFGPSPQQGVTKEAIDSMIGQAINFYHSLDDRLDQIEQRFH